MIEQENTGGQHKIYLRRIDLEKRLQVSGKTIYTWIKGKGFPAPRKFGNISRWDLQEVEQWENRQPQEVAA